MYLVKLLSFLDRFRWSNLQPIGYFYSWIIKVFPINLWKEYDFYCQISASNLKLIHKSLSFGDLLSYEASVWQTFRFLNFEMAMNHLLWYISKKNPFKQVKLFLVLTDQIFTCILWNVYVYFLYDIFQSKIFYTFLFKMNHSPYKFDPLLFLFTVIYHPKKYF